MNYLLKNTDNKILKNEGNTLLQATDGMPEPILDLDANAAEMQANYTDGQKVSVWYDSSVVRNNTRQSNEAFQPVWKTNALNGLPALEFTESYMEFPNTLNIKTVFVVYRNASNVDGNLTRGCGHTLLGNSSASNYNMGGYGLVFKNNSNNLVRTAQMAADPNNQAYINNNTPIPCNGNGLVKMTNYHLMNLDLHNENLCNQLGRQYGFISAININQFFSGSIARLIIYNRRLTPLQRIARRDELMTLYNL